MKPSRTQDDLADSRCAPRQVDDVQLAVLWENEHFCVIDKPADVRMDGDFDVTVEKVMKKSLANRLTSGGGGEIALKWIHQLDFATSGVLCVGLTRAGAAAASSCFEHREVDKTYLAVVAGHVCFDQWPVAPYEVKMEIKAPFKRRKLCKEQQRQPDSWQQQVLMTNLDTLWNALQSVDAQSIESAEKRAEVARMQALSLDDLSRAPKKRKELRKLLKSLGINVELVDSMHSALPPLSGDASPEAQTAHTALSQDALWSVAESYHRHDPPSIFRKQGEEDILVVRIPVAEVADDFRMEPGHASNPGKPCETEVTVLQHACYQGQPVTKVLLRPRTGRRHQLRIHMMCLRHPIIGDYTYNFAHQSLVNRTFYPSSCSSTEGTSAVQDACVEPNATAGDVAERMMLHAYRLRIPYPVEGKCSTSLRQALGVDLSGGTMVQAEAPDPFPVRDGTVRPVLPTYVAKTR